MSAATEPSHGIETDDALRGLIDDHLATVIAGIAHERLREATSYAVLGGGKRVRPILALRVCSMLGGTHAQVLPGAAAFELIHAFSLVHDDLPALDDDDMRRGKPTLHKAFGESLAILAGDMLQTLAMHEASRSPCNPPAIVAELAEATAAMIEGQTWDTDGCFPEGLEPAEQLELVHRNKTAALIRGACRTGAIATDADRAALEAIDRWGTALGLMFQVVDDILDETQSTEHLGKAAGKDQAQGKLTYPSVHGLQGARDCVSKLEIEADQALEQFGEAAAPLRNIASSLAVRTR